MLLILSRPRGLGEINEMPSLGHLGRFRSHSGSTERTAEVAPKQAENKQGPTKWSGQVCGWSWGESNPRPSGENCPRYDHPRVSGLRQPHRRVG